MLEAEVVIADGKIRVVNACNHPDLFWALKGGGGGRFGVITRLTLRTRDLPDFFGGLKVTIERTSTTRIAACSFFVEPPSVGNMPENSTSKYLRIREA